MTRMSRLTVSIPADLLQALDRKLARNAESRSAVVRRLLEQALRDAEEQADLDRYVHAYRRRPQTEEECGWSDDVARERLSELPW
ncbi:MAG: ribbon-helix-helix protein, CopG family [Chloroflexi bacterium]|nr:ribbon-helix-helix protein, CopG family [Chloroflexota bacterium]